MFDSIVVVHPDHGIFVGAALGLGFWSKLDNAGQSSVATFETMDEAAEIMRQWNQKFEGGDLKYIAVACEDEFAATIEELKAAGLEDDLGMMAQQESLMVM